MNSKTFESLWVIRDELTSKSKIDSVVLFAQKAHISQLFVQVRGRGTVYYDSRFEDKAHTVSTDLDPLHYILEQAHKKNIKVHAWFNTFLVWSRDSLPRSPNHPLNKFPDAMLKDKFWNDYSGLDSHDKKNVEGFYLSPFRLQVKQYLLEMVKELVTHYAINGIHFDYIRYPNNKFINDPEIISYLNNRYGLLLLHKNLSSTPIGDDVLYSEHPKIGAVLEKPINSFLKDVHSWVKRNFPQVAVSAAVKANPVQAKYEYFQDWMTWLKDGYVDFVVTMNYSSDSGIFRRNLAMVADTAFRKKIVVGIGAFNKTKNVVSEQKRIAIDQGFKGISYFSYKHMKNKI